MPRAGLTPHGITRAAAHLLDREGQGSLTLARLASELGVKPPSLYSHVDGLEALERLVALHAIDMLSEACREAVMGKAGPDGLRAMVSAYRSFANRHPGIYPLTQVARPGDAEYEEKARRFLEAVLAVLFGFGLDQSALVHAARGVRSALHGFALLESGSGFGLTVDVDESFEWMLGMLERGLKAGSSSA